MSRVVAFAFVVMLAMVGPGSALAASTIDVAPSPTVVSCDDATLTLSVNITSTDNIRGYEVRVTVDETILALAGPGAFAEGGFLGGPGPNTAFLVNEVVANTTYLVTGTILGATGGATGPGTLFTITGDPILEGTTGIVFSDLKIRDPNNGQLSGTATDGTVNVDCTAPCVTDVAGSTCWTAAAPLTITGNETPAYGVAVTLEYQYQPDAGACNDAGTWTTLASGLTLTGTGWSTTQTPGAPPASPGNWTIHVRATDDVGNVGLCSGCAASLNFNYNPAAPTAVVTDLTATPGHDKVDLTWTNPTLVSGEEVVIVRVRTNGYPTYGGTYAYPTTIAGGTEILSTSTATSYTDNVGDGTLANRDIYLYRAFVRNCADAEFPSPGATNLDDDFVTENTTDGTDAATNYWLGDLDETAAPGNWGGPYDGYVTNEDLNLLSSQYGLEPPVHAEADYAPTKMPAFGAQGIPDPDNRADFEDLIVLAINYNTVAPLTGEAAAEIALGRPGSGPVRLALRELPAGEEVGNRFSAELLLKGAAGQVQGLTTTITFDPAKVVFESAEVSRAIAPSPHFFKAVRRAGGVELGFALLGHGAAMGGEGAVAVLNFRLLDDARPALRLTDSKVRDTENQELLVQKPGIAHESAIIPAASAPLAYRLHEAKPNPFNPSTTIAFDLPRREAVSLVVYDASGRLVRTLVNELLAAGSHRAEWNGTDASGRPAASGIYFYELRAGDFRQERRMSLIK